MAVNALELAVLLRRIRSAVVLDEGKGGDVRELLSEAGDAIEDLVVERDQLVETWNSGVPALDGPCLECEGRGCKECVGSGWLPTNAGLQVLMFLERSRWRPA